jgi:prolyl-tRNA synthetase
MRAETGPIGGDLSHEFIVLAETGESAVYCDRRVLELPIPGEDIDYDSDLTPIIDRWTRLYAATEDVHEQARYERETAADDRLMTRGIEVGQVFFFGDKYSKPMKAMIAGPDGVERPAQMGSYGIGVSRLLGAIIEASHDDNGIIWPEAVAPFKVGLINLRAGDAKCVAAADNLYAKLGAAGVEVLYDDREDSPGTKFATMDLIGLPYQLVIGPRGVANNVVEVKERATGAKSELSPDAVLNRLTAQ